MVLQTRDPKPQTPNLRTANSQTLKPKTRTLKLSNPNPNPDIGVEQSVLRRCVCAASGEVFSPNKLRTCKTLAKRGGEGRERGSERLHFATSPTIADLAMLLVATLAFSQCCEFHHVVDEDDDDGACVPRI